MTLLTPTGAESSPPPASITASVPSTITPNRRRLWRWVGFLAFAAALAGGGAGAWWWSRPPQVIPPPIPADLSEEEVRKVIEYARQQVLAKPDSASAWGRLGMTFMTQLFDREADACYREAARLNPSDPRWPYARGLMALKRDSEHALPLLRHAATASDSVPRYSSFIHLRLAEALLERQETEEAEQLFRKEWERAPGNPRAALSLGRIALARGDDRAAQDFLTAALDHPSSRRSARSHLAALAHSRGDAAAAAEYERQAAALPYDQVWPDLFLEEVVSMRVGRIRRELDLRDLEDKHRYAEAVRLYLEEIARQPTSEACVGAGRNLARLRRYDQAMPLLRRGVELDANSPLAHYTLALVLFSQAEKQPNSPAAKGWLHEATVEARRATELKPDYDQAYLFWGLSLKLLGEKAAAVAPLRKGVVCRPNDFELQLGLGQVLADLGQEQEARTHLENAQKLDPKDPRPAEALARLPKKD